MKTLGTCKLLKKVSKVVGNGSQFIELGELLINVLIIEWESY